MDLAFNIKRPECSVASERKLLTKLLRHILIKIFWHNTIYNEELLKRTDVNNIRDHIKWPGQSVVSPPPPVTSQ